MYCILFFIFSNSAPTLFYSLSLHDALPILNLSQVLGMNRSTIVRLQSQPSGRGAGCGALHFDGIENGGSLEFGISEEHTSELQSRFELVCRLLLEKKKGRRLSRRIFSAE